MLVAFTNGDEAGPRLVNFTTSRFGAVPDALRAHGVALFAWPSAAGAVIDRTLGAAIEGHVEWSRHGLPDQSVDLSPGDLSAARGDFALMAATRVGLIVASGQGGGYRPIYVGSIPGGHLASTRLERLVDVLGRPPLDHDFLAGASLLERRPSHSLTPYSSVQRVPPGEAWILRRGAITRLSTVRGLGDPELKASEKDLAVMLRGALERATLSAVGTARRVAVAASGGLDSSALVALLVKLANEGKLDPPRVYSWDFDTPSPGDDRPHMRALWDHFGLPARPIFPSEASQTFRAEMVLDGAPCTFPMVPLWASLARRAVNDGSSIVLSGIGGDQVLDGLPYFFGDLALSNPLLALRSALRLRGPLVGTARERVANYVLRPLASRLVPSPLRRARQKSGLLRRYPWAGPRLRAYISALAEMPFARPSLDWSPNERYRALVAKPLFDELDTLRAQEESVAGHTRRDPYTDDDFLRFVATLPPLSLLFGDRCRGLLREAMRGLLPESVRLRTTKAYMSPALLEAMRPVGGFDCVRDLVDARCAADLGLVEPRALRKEFDALVSRPLERPWLYMWTMLSVEAFLRRWAGEHAHVGVGVDGRVSGRRDAVGA